MEIGTFAQYAAILSAVIALLTFIGIGGGRKRSRVADERSGHEATDIEEKSNDRKPHKKSFAAHIVSLLLFIFFWIFLGIVIVYFCFYVLNKYGISLEDNSSSMLVIGVFLVSFIVTRKLKFVWK